MAKSSRTRKPTPPPPPRPAARDGRHAPETPIAPIARETLSVRVAQALQAFVVHKHLVQGDRLPSERTLSQSFQVSIPVIREALRTLEARSVLRTQHGRGIFVHDPDQARRDGVGLFADVTTAELGTARVAFELGVVDLVCARVTTRDCAALEAILEPTKAGEPFTVHTDLAFHLRLLHITRNPVLIQMGEGLLRQFFRLTAMARPDVALTGHSSRGAADQVKRHLALVAALRRRDATALRSQILHHLDSVPGFRRWSRWGATPAQTAGGKA